MERRGKKRAPVGVTPRTDAVRIVHDRYWARELRSAVLSGVLLFGALVLLDWGLVRLTAVRAGWWAALAVLLLIILTPPRVSAADGGLDARGLVTHRRVRTDRLVTVRMSEGVAQRLILTDTSGGRLVLDPRVLLATGHTAVWHAGAEAVGAADRRRGVPRNPQGFHHGVARRVPTGPEATTWESTLLRRPGVGAGGARR
ncbi:hypothetical protein ACWD1Y_43040 [Streptomyces sp. NPDC002814]